MPIDTHAILWYGLDLGTDFIDAVADDDDYDTREADLEPFRCTLGDYWDAEGTGGHYLAIEEAVHLTEPGEVLDWPALRVGKDWETRLRAYCARSGIPWATPGWRLTCTTECSTEP